MAFLIFLAQSFLVGVDSVPLDPASLTVAATLAVGAALLWLALPARPVRTESATEPYARTSALRRWQQRVGVVVSAAPNGPGKPRSRAPGAAATAA